MISEERINRSLKKFFIDNIQTAASIPVSFDGTIESPPIAGAKEWVSFKFGSIEPGSTTRVFLYIFLCTTEDPEGVDLAGLRDVVIGLLMSESKSVVRLPIYGADSWTIINHMLVEDIQESKPENYESGQKIKSLVVRFVVMDY